MLVCVVGVTCKATLLFVFLTTMYIGYTIICFWQLYYPTYSDAFVSLLKYLVGLS